MSYPLRISRKDYPIPSNLNLFLSIGSILFAIFILKWTDIQNSVWLKIIGAIAFSYINNTIFAILHEATHGQAHSNRLINNVIGRFTAAMFPTSFSLQQLYHLGHHRRNRTDAEMFDLYYPGDSIALKKFIIWGTVFGIYWMSPFISCLMYLVNPNWILDAKIKDSKMMKALSADHMLGGLEKTLSKTTTPRLEVVFTLLFQFLLFYFLNLSFSTWILCYWFFGMNWGSLQYADHVGSVRNIKEGAWNLKVNPITKRIFLNYHTHLVHHRYPNLPWIHLPKLVRPEDPTPTFSSKLIEFLTGPRPTLMGPPDFDKSFDPALFEGTPYEEKKEYSSSEKLNPNLANP